MVEGLDGISGNIDVQWVVTRVDYAREGLRRVTVMLPVLFISSSNTLSLTL